MIRVRAINGEFTPVCHDHTEMDLNVARVQIADADGTIILSESVLAVTIRSIKDSSGVVVTEFVQSLD